MSNANKFWAIVFAIIWITFSVFYKEVFFTGVSFMLGFSITYWGVKMIVKFNKWLNKQ